MEKDSKKKLVCSICDHEINNSNEYCPFCGNQDFYDLDSISITAKADRYWYFEKGKKKRYLYCSGCMTQFKQDDIDKNIFNAGTKTTPIWLCLRCRKEKRM